MQSCTFVISLLFYSWDSFVVFVQVTQQVFVAEEWVRDTRNEARVEALSHADVEKSLGALKQEQAELFEKLKKADQAHLSAEASLKTVERQAEDQRQKLHLIEIDLATQRQLVIDLKTELQKGKEAIQLAKEAAEVEKQVAYALGVEETLARLTEELAKVCRDCCDATWDKTLNVAGVPTNSALRQLGSKYYQSNIRKVLGAIPPPSATTPESLEQPLVAQAALPLPKDSKGPNQADDQGQGAEGVKDKGKGKEAKPSSVAEDAAKANAKETEAKTKKIVPQAKDAPAL